MYFVYCWFNNSIEKKLKKKVEIATCHGRETCPFFLSHIIIQTSLMPELS